MLTLSWFSVKHLFCNRNITLWYQILSNLVIFYDPQNSWANATVTGPKSQCRVSEIRTEILWWCFSVPRTACSVTGPLIPPVWLLPDREQLTTVHPKPITPPRRLIPSHGQPITIHQTSIQIFRHSALEVHRGSRVHVSRGEDPAFTSGAPEATPGERGSISPGWFRGEIRTGNTARGDQGRASRLARCQGHFLARCQGHDLAGCHAQR